MDIRIGIINSPREISFESASPAAEIQAAIAQALDSDARYFSLTDNKGTIFVIPVATFGYIEIGAENQRRVGFVA